MIPLQNMNTLAIPAMAREVHRITDTTTLRQLLSRFAARDITPVILGGGSNVVLADRIAAPVCLIRTRGIRAEREGGKVIVSVAAGENWHDLVRWTLANGLAGLENLALIPGLVGAAPVQNIGAYGQELATRFVGLIAIEVVTGRQVHMTHDDVSFGYRTSIFKENPGCYVIAEVSLALDADGKASVDASYADVGEELDRMGRQAGSSPVRPVDVAEAVVRIRRRKLPDPRLVPNAGSFFKNPVVTEEQFASLRAAHGPLKSYPDAAGVKLAAAELIARCRLSGEHRQSWSDSGPVRLWGRQPLVLINPGRVGAGEVLGLAGAVQEAVAEQFEIRLQMEPDLIGMAARF